MPRTCAFLALGMAALALLLARAGLPAAASLAGIGALVFMVLAVCLGLDPKIPNYFDPENR
jgi:hypothetical protein